MKAAARSYFGVNDLSELTPAQAATLAALPKSPSNYDLVRNAVEECLEPGEKEGECAKSQLVVPPDTTVVERRNQILTLMAEDGRTPKSDGQYTAEELLAARDEPVVLVPQTTERWQAPQFVWRVRDELATKLCGEDATCPELDHGGLRITTTLDLDVQKTAEKWVKAAAVVPFQDNPQQAAKRLGLKYEDWMRNLADKRLRNGALVAMDYQTGELIAYVGSADYYSTKHSKRFQPKYDVVGDGYRQPGSAFKPFNYAIGIDSGKLTAGTVLMDVGTDFGNNYTPNDADRLERGPLTVRSALQFSLNIPSVKAMEVNDPATVFERAQEFGLRFRGDSSNAGLSLALGTQETPPVDLATGYAHDRQRRPVHREHLDPHGQGPQAARTSSIRTSRPSRPRSSARRLPTSRRTSWPATRIATSTRSGASSRSRAPAGTAARPPSRPARTTTPRTSTPTASSPRRPASSARTGSTRWSSERGTATATTARSAPPTIRCSRSTSTTYVWQGFLQETTKDWPIRNFRRPEEGLVKVSIDPFTGYLPQRGDKGVEEWFIVGTEPKNRLPREACGREVLDLLAFESKFPNWLEWDRDWLRRARRGPGAVGGPDRTAVTYFYNNRFNPFGRRWGPVMGQDCAEPTPQPSCVPLPSPDASGVIPSFELPEPSGDAPALVACPPESATPEPSAPPSEVPSPPPEPTPEATPTPEPDPTPTRAEPDPTPTPPPDSPAPPAP